MRTHVPTYNNETALGKKNAAELRNKTKISSFHKSQITKLKATPPPRLSRAYIKVKITPRGGHYDSFVICDL